MVAKLSCAIWILTTLFMRKGPKIFTGTLQKMWRKGLIRVDIQRMITDHYPLGKKRWSLMKDELGGKIMTEFVALRAKMYAYRKIDK